VKFDSLITLFDVPIKYSADAVLFAKFEVNVQFVAFIEALLIIQIQPPSSYTKFFSQVTPENGDIVV